MTNKFAIKAVEIMQRNSKIVAVLLASSCVVLSLSFYQHRQSNSSDSLTIYEKNMIELDRRNMGFYPNLEKSATALKKNPDDAKAYRGLAMYYARIGNRSQATENWRKAAEVEPNNDYNKMELGLSLRAARQFSQAAEVFHQIENHDSTQGPYAQGPYAKKMLKAMKSLGQIP